MSTIFLQNQIEGCPQYVDFDPYKTTGATPLYRVSVSDNYLYDKTTVELGKDGDPTGATYSLSNDLFEDFLLNHVFRIYKTGGDNAAAATTDDYTADTSSDTPPTYIIPAQIKLDGTNATATHLAGSLFTYNVGSTSTTVPVNFNCALLMEETFDNNGTSISKVDIELRMTEPLMQTLLSTTGNAYDFKKAVKISDFMNNLEQVEEDSTDPQYKQGFFQFRMMEPTNMSVAKDSVSTTPISAPTKTIGTGESAYTTGATQPNAAPILGATAFTTDDYTAVTNFTGYFIMCTFGESVASVTTSDGLLSKKPYLTIIRIVHSKIVNTQFNEIFDAKGLSGYTPSDCILNYISNTADDDGQKNVVINADDIGVTFPFDVALTISTALKNSTTLAVIPGLYVMNSMITS